MVRGGGREVHSEHEGDEPLDTREARFSLRARLAEEGHAGPVAASAPGETASAPPAEPDFPAFSQPAPEAPAPEPPAPRQPSFPAFQAVPDPEPEPVAAEPEPEPAAFEEPAPAEPSYPAFGRPAPAEPEEEPARDEPAPAEPSFPAFETPAVAPPPPPDPPAPTPFERPVPEPDPGYISYEALPAITPEADEPRAPGEDTNEIPPLPDDPADAPVAEEPPPPPTVLRPPPPPPPRPFSGEGASFRSAIDAARERVHGTAREATPDEGESTEPIEERSSVFSSTNLRAVRPSVPPSRNYTSSLDGFRSHVHRIGLSFARRSAHTRSATGGTT